MKRIATMLLATAWLLLIGAEAISGGEKSDQQIMAKEIVHKLYGPMSVVYDTARKCYYVANESPLVSWPVVDKGGNHTQESIAPNDSQKVVRVDQMFREHYMPNIDIFSPAGMSIIGDSLYFLDAFDARILGYDLNDTTVFMEIFVDTVNYPKLNDMTPDGLGNLYITARDTGIIYKLEISTETLTTVQTTGDALIEPLGIYHDQSKGRMLITSFVDSNAALYELRLDSMIVNTLVQEGSLSKLVGVTKDRYGNYLVSSWGTLWNKRGNILKFDSTFSDTTDYYRKGVSTPCDIYYNEFTDTLVVPTRSTKKLINYYNFADPPGTPTLVYPANNATDVEPTVEFKWNEVARGYSYYVQISLDSANIDSTKIMTFTDVSGSKIIDNSLQMDTTYYWRVQAYNGGGESNWSDIWKFSTADTIYSKPWQIYPEFNAENTENDMQFLWDSVPGAISYTLKLSIDWGEANPVEYITTDTTYLVEDLILNLDYTWRVMADFDSNRVSWSWSSDFTTSDTIVNPPSTFPAGGDNEDPVSLTPTLTWSDSGADYYDLQVANSESGSVKKGDIIQSSSGDFANPIIYAKMLTDTIYTIESGLSEKSSYVWRVRAYKNEARSKWSEPSPFETTDGTSVLGGINDNESFRIIPNPARTSTSIGLNLAKDANVIIEIYDLHGLKVSEAYNGHLSEGINNIPVFLNNLQSGVYFTRIKIEGLTLSKRLVVLK